MAARAKLTPDRVKTKKKPGLYGDGGGLYLRVTTATARSWVFRYAQGWKVSAKGKRYPDGREMGLGSFPEIDLPAARDLAEHWRRVKAAGKDPLQVRESERAAERLQAAKVITFRQCAETYIADHKESWKNAKHTAQWTATLETYAMPTIGDVPVGAVDRALVIRILEPIWKTKTETARRLRGRIEAVLDWATARDYREGENPARWKGYLNKVFPAHTRARSVQHHPALPYRELPAFMAKLKAEEGVSAVALQFTILTAGRTSEVIGAKWAEVEFDSAVWTVPGKRMKGQRGKEREHRVPLSKPALALLREQFKATSGQGYIFPGERPKKHLSNMAMLALLARMGRDDITVHGFRSTFRDWAEEMTNFAGTVAEAALAHVVGDKVEAAYRRGDLFEKRRKLMAAWAMFCTTPAASGTVIPMKARK